MPPRRPSSLAALIRALRGDGNSYRLVVHVQHRFNSGRHLEPFNKTRRGYQRRVERRFKKINREQIGGMSNEGSR